MSLKQIEGETGEERVGARQRFARLRAWLRHGMPRVAIAAAILLIARMLLSRTFLFGDNILGGLLEFISSSLILVTLLYYGLKALRWMKRRLLWRVRRRLVVTYLFVGLTPIILLALFGMVASFGTSGEAMARIITAQMNATDEEAARSAQSIAAAFSQLPASVSDQDVQSWLSERAATLQGSLPGARLALWRAAGDEDVHTLGQTQAQFTAESDDDSTRGVGTDRISVGAALPEWLRQRDAWHGLIYIAPEEGNLATPSFRALVRGTTTARQKPFVLLLSVPVSRVLIERYRETTGIYVRPFFGATRLMRRQFDTSGARRSRNANTQSVNSDAPVSEQETERRNREMMARDQLGEPLPRGTTPYVVISTATDWETGAVDRKLSFLFDWSWSIAGRQF
ncbi:MAG: hypothetical protein ICV60_12720, partial [Pyrinomonadaceae bacterium]|nr:hypothetical protein [Pyrinomonadaceae bacterium]